MSAQLQTISLPGWVPLMSMALPPAGDRELFRDQFHIVGHDAGDGEVA
ncbi:MAG: hypothetical protein R3A10_18850 [Caldilineaceae bacterium]